MLLLSVSLNLNYFSTYQYYDKRALAEQIVLVGFGSFSWNKPENVYYVSGPKQGLEMEAVVLGR